MTRLTFGALVAGVLTLLATVFLFVARALAGATVPDPSTDPGGFFQALLNAVSSKDWRLVVAAVLVGLVYALRRLIAPRVSWFATDRGGVVLTLATALLGTFAAQLASGTAINGRFFLDGVGLALTAAGGYTVVRRLIWPKDNAHIEAAASFAEAARSAGGAKKKR